MFVSNTAVKLQNRLQNMQIIVRKVLLLQTILRINRKNKKEYKLYLQYEQEHDKPTKWHVRPAKTQISLGIRPVWSESSLSAWRTLGSLATHWAQSGDSD